jgi:hypothetical protein
MQGGSRTARSTSQARAGPGRRTPAGDTPPLLHRPLPGSPHPPTQPPLPPLGLQDGHRQRTINWIDQTGGSAAAFDFTTKGILQEALGRNELWRLVDSQGRPPGMLGMWWVAAPRGGAARGWAGGRGRLEIGGEGPGAHGAAACEEGAVPRAPRPSEGFQTVVAAPALGS